MTVNKLIIMTELDWAYLSRVWVARSSHAAWPQTHSAGPLPCTAEE